MYNGNDWKKYINFKNDTYNKELIYRNNYFEMVLISWNKNQISPIHDHPNNGCVLKIMDGVLIEEKYKKKNKEIELLNISKYEKNSVSYMIGDKILHKIINLDQPTNSLHIYSPPNYIINKYKL